MSQETVEKTPVVTASESSWRCVQARDKDGWLALMADDVLIEDPIGPSTTNPDGSGVRGKDAVASFFDSTIGVTKSMKITCEETFPSSSPDEIAHILLLQFAFEGGFASSVRGIFTYRTNDAGLLTNLRGYWNMDMMKFEKPEGDSD
jgi:steroid Delta-isomerase